MTIYCDDHIGSNHLPRYLNKVCCHKTVLTRLDSGDCCWLGNGPDGLVNVGVELKKIHDLVESMDDGRLAGTQLIAAANHYHYYYLLVQGLYKRGDDGILLVWHKEKGKRKAGWKELSHGKRRYMYSIVSKALNTLSVKCGIIPIRSGEDIETAGTIADLYGWWQTPWDSHISHKRKNAVECRLSLTGKRPPKLTLMLQDLDGVGLKRAEAITRAYGNMSQLVKEDCVENIAAIPYDKRRDGTILTIGKGTAAGIYQQIREGEDVS